jgi:GntR family transcriptional regulator of vanillate catabolism
MARGKPKLKLTDQVVLKLRELILGGEIAAGQRVTEVAISEQLGVSRTPVREALAILSQEGLLGAAGNRGYLVQEFGSKDIEDAIEVRGLLEGAAARMVAEKGPDTVLLAALESCLADGAALASKKDYSRDEEMCWAEINHRFHSLIAEACGNRALISVLMLNDKLPFASSKTVVGGDTSTAQNMARHREIIVHAQADHQQIVTALRLRQSARVEALMREHARLAQSKITLFWEMNSINDQTLLP